MLFGQAARVDGEDVGRQAAMQVAEVHAAMDASRANSAGSPLWNALRAAGDEKAEKMVKVPVKVVTKENVAGFED